MVSSTPRFWPSTLNNTPPMPEASEARALTVTVPDTAAGGSGEVTATAGGVASGVARAWASADAALTLCAASSAVSL